MSLESEHANNEFHDLIIEVAGSPRLAEMARSVRRFFHVHEVWTGTLDLRGEWETNVQQHRAIREAILAGSPEAARQLMRTHVLSTGQLIETILLRLEESPPRRSAG